MRKAPSEAKARGKKYSAKNKVGNFQQICDVGMDWGCAGRVGR